MSLTDTAPGPRILVVEDDPNIAELLDFMLQHDGYQTLVASDGMQALRLIAEQAPTDAAILDVMLPYRDGYAVAQAMRAHDAWKQVPILMLTAKNLPADKARGLSAGVTTYLTKPFEPETLSAEVARMLRERV